MLPRPWALTALLLTVFSRCTRAERLIQSDSLNPCMANSSLSATLFNVVFTPNNRTLTFNIVGVSDISGNVTAELDLYAYGKRILQRNLDPCAQGDLRQLCPMNTGQINIESNLVLDQDVVNDIPGIAYAVPDLDARVQIYIKDANSGAARACVEADLLNGKTVYQHAVGWTTAVIVLLALIASAVASSLGHSNTAAHVASYTLSLFGYFQNQAYIGMTAVNLPPIVDSWTQNFQWSMGIIKLKSLQKLATWYQRATGGTPSTIVSSVMNASVQVEKKLIKRAIDLASRLSKRADEGSSSTGSQVTVVRGIERVGFRAGIETTNIFATAYIFFVLFSIVVIGCAVLFKLLVEVLEKTGRLQNNKLREFREKWRAVFKGIIIRIGLITFPLLAVVCCWELTSRDSAAEVVVAIMTLLASIVILGRSCLRVILKAKRSNREHKTPGYLLFSNPVFLTQWGALYLQFKTACYYFTLPLLVFVFVKALFVAFAQSSGTVQGFAFFILDLALLVTLAIMRPYMDTKTNVVNIFVAVINFISSILLLIFTEVFNQPGLATGVCGLVFFFFNAVAALVLLIIVLSATYIAIVSKNPDKRYQPVQDDRGSFMKSRDQLGGEELNDLAYTARNGHPFGASSRSSLEPSKPMLHAEEGRP